MRERRRHAWSPAGPLIAAAEKSGRAGVIDRWVLSTTLAWIEDQPRPACRNTRFVCMNLSGASLNDERFVQDTLDILARHVHVASRLCMEITESVALHDLDNTRRFIDQVRAFGVKVALDDFGAGYTSFSYLKELPADVLKIDGNFIVNINAHPANVAIVEAIVSLAVNLGMKTIAEWAEDAATVRTLAEIGVDYVQGYAVRVRSRRKKCSAPPHRPASSRTKSAAAGAHAGRGSGPACAGRQSPACTICTNALAHLAGSHPLLAGAAGCFIEHLQAGAGSAQGGRIARKHFAARTGIDPVVVIDRGDRQRRPDRGRADHVVGRRGTGGRHDHAAAARHCTRHPSGSPCHRPPRI